MTTPAARPKKSLGQHFLVDRRVLSRISAAAEISSDDVVVEIGPGRGVLTKHLAERASRVVAVELDEALANWLSDDLADRPNVEVVCADAREVDLARLVRPDTPYKVAANIPYYAALPILRRFLEAEHKPELMAVMVQREVGRKIAAAPGGMGLVSVAVQLYGRPRIVSYVPPRAFRPAPKVTSAILRIDLYPRPALDVDSEKFFELVRAGFSAPRKQIRNCFRDGLALDTESVNGMLLGAGIDPKRRAQTVSIEEWGSLYTEWRALAPS